MNTIDGLLSAAGLSGGRVSPSKFVQIMMAKQKEQAEPYSRENIVRPFDPDRLDNPSEFIQRKYKDGEVKPFDACMAQVNKEREEEDEDAYSVVKLAIKYQLPIDKAIALFEKIRADRKTVMNPAHWGLTWAQLRQDGNHLVTADGLRFPPVLWKNPSDGTFHWGLPCCGGAPAEGAQRNRWQMLYFREDDMPDIKTTMGETASRDFRNKQKERQRAGLPVLPADGDEKQFGDVTLVGTTDVRGRSEADIKRWNARRKGELKKREVYRRDRVPKSLLETVRRKLDKRPEPREEAAAAPAPARDVGMPDYSYYPAELRRTMEDAWRRSQRDRLPAVRAEAPQLLVEEVARPPARKEPEPRAAPPPPPPPARVEPPPAAGRKPTREELRLAYNAASGSQVGHPELIRIANALGVTPDSTRATNDKLRYKERRWILKEIIKVAPEYDINTGAKKMANGDIKPFSEW